MFTYIHKNLQLFVGGIFLLCGLGLLGVGSSLFLSFSRFENTALSTTAVITGIVVTRSGNRSEDMNHKVYVGYEVNGIRYNERLPSYWSGMREGQEIEILYNPDNPGELDTKHGGLFTLLFVGIGVVFSVLGGVLTHLELKRRRHVRRLIAEGQAVTADVLEVYQDNSVTHKINGRRTHPYRILCEWTNPADGIRHEFESDALWDYPGDIVRVTVYRNPANLQDYHVSVDS